MAKQKKFKSFQDFTNLYELSKTLRFELKPNKIQTKEMLKQVIFDDIEKDRLYHEVMKSLFDNFHNEFIQQSLQKVSFEQNLFLKFKIKLADFKESQKKRQNLLRNKKENQQKIDQLEKGIDALKTEITQIQENLRCNIVNEFNETGLAWKEYWNKREFKVKDKNGNKKTKKFTFKKEKNKKNNYNILTDASILKVLEIQENEKNNTKNIEAIKKFEKFFMYFDGLNKNRENYYSDEEKHTGVAFRIVHENLPRFLENRKAFKEIQEALPFFKKYETSFSLQNFKKLLIQKDIEKFNEEVLGEINYEVNQYNQKNKTRLPKLKILYKQIGAEKKKGDIFEIEKGKEWEKLQNLVSKQHAKKIINKETKELLSSVQNFYKHFFANTEKFSLGEIFFNKQSINTVSSSWFVNWQTLADILQVRIDKKSGEQKIPSQISLTELQSALEEKENILEKNQNGREESSLLAIFKLGKNGEYKERFGKNAWETFLNIWKYETEKNFAEIKILEKELKQKSREKFNKKEHGRFIKSLCDAYLAVERMAKYHKVKEEQKTDGNFYEIFDAYLEEEILKKYYDAFRNYISKKPFNEEKIKLNFNCGYLLGGWAQNYESYGALIFTKDEKYYLGIINGSKFSEQEAESLLEKITPQNKAQRFVYDFQKPDNKNTPRLFIRSKGENYAPAVKDLNLPIESVISIYDQKLFQIDKKNFQKHKPYLFKMIDYFKEGFQKHPSYKHFDFNWKDSEKYQNIAQFYQDVLNSCYKTGWETINFDVLKKLEEKKRIFLFQIYNKDFGKVKKDSNKNLHTMLFLELLKPKNARKLRLLGGGEIFYRKATKDLPVRKKNGYEMTFKDKRDDEKEKKVLEHRRYAEDKFFLHFPISVKGKGTNLSNKDVNTFLAQQNDLCILGIDRGEKHFLYYSLIDSKGNIKKQGSLNKLQLGVEQGEVDFHDKLSKRADDMMEARKNWETIGNIKNFKEGYLSHVVHQIYNLIIKHNAIVVMEDLNTQFKAKRGAKVEKAIYKKFELALAKKLNHLILKDKEANETGGVLNAYQFTPKIEAGNISIFEKSRQWGILFYVRPNYTSITDPLTGWRPNLYLKYKTSKEFGPAETKKDILKFNLIEFKNGRFEFTYDLKNFISGAGEVLQKTKWTLCSSVERFYWNNQKRTSESFPILTKNFQNLFTNAGIDWQAGNIKEQIEKLKPKGHEPFFKGFIFLWKLLGQIRNTDSKKEGSANDFLLSPVWSEEVGDFFDSRKASQYKNKIKKELPENGDANGAYNTARKGLMLIQRVKENPQNYNSLILDEEWDNFNQK